MTAARLVPVDVPGLNLLLGGGVPVLERHKGAGESAVLLLRGPPGSGKTVLGTQLAGALARELVPGKTLDVAYGCIELLPVELAAQHAGLKAPGLQERVITPPFSLDAPASHKRNECLIYADLLALSPGEEQADIEAAIERQLKLIEDAGGKPRVVVIDSLSDGYNLGSQAPRVLADAISKLAVMRGMIFILLEETTDGRPSGWSFAADLVMELGERTHGESERQERTISVTKHRFGRAAPGVHGATIAHGSRYTIWPEASAYVSGSWRSLQKERNRLTERDWGNQNLDNQKSAWPRLSNQTIAIVGSIPAEVRKFAHSLASPSSGEVELAINISDIWAGPADYTIADPYITGAQLLSLVLGSKKLAGHQSLTRVIIGDMNSLLVFSFKEEIVRSLMVLSALLHDANIPLILFDSSGLLDLYYHAPTGTKIPLFANFSDVRIVGWSSRAGGSYITATQDPDYRVEWHGVL